MSIYFKHAAKTCVGVSRERFHLRSIRACPLPASVHTKIYDPIYSTTLSANSTRIHHGRRVPLSSGIRAVLILLAPYHRFAARTAPHTWPNARLASNNVGALLICGCSLRCTRFVGTAQQGIHHWPRLMRIADVGNSTPSYSSSDCTFLYLSCVFEFYANTITETMLERPRKT